MTPKNSAGELLLLAVVGHSHAFWEWWSPTFPNLMLLGLWDPWAAMGFARLDLAKWVKAEAGQS